MDTDGYDISEVRGHLRFILSFVLHAAQLCLPSAPSTSPFTLPFISIRFFCRSCSLIISFCSSLAHVTFSLSLSLFLLAPSLVHASRLARRFYFSLSIRANPVSPVPPPKGGSSSFHPARSCFYFLSAFLPPLFRPRTTAAPLSLVVLASSSKLNALSKSILSTVPGYVFGFNFDSSKENSPSFRNFTSLECSIGV